LTAEEFAGHGLAVSGVDANPEMIPLAQTYVQTGSFQQAPAEALPHPDHAFDLVFLGLLLHESDEPRQVLSEAHRVARHRVAVLEWPYQEGVFGPPLAHRVSPLMMAEWVQQVGFSQWEALPLTNVVLYRLGR
jgi:ubiquinone/menaquinone biosynthesis C-methylase UbiE